MRVLFNAMQAGNRSGTGRHTVELLRALAALPDGPELAAAWPGGVEQPENCGAVHFEVLPASHGRRLLADQFALPRLAARSGVDALHYPANVGVLRAAGCPVLLTIHDLSFLHHPEWFRWERAQYYRHAVRRGAGLAARIIAVSRFTADDVCDVLGVPAGRVDVVHNGVCGAFRPAGDTAVDAVRRKYGLPERFFFFTGTIEPRKNLERLVRAFRGVAEQGAPEDLVLAGRAGWKLTAARLLEAAGSMHRRVRLIGHVPDADLPALHGAARAFVWPSLFEGFGLPVLEAMACGAAVLTSNTSALPEVAGDAALLIAPEDTDAIAGALARLSEDDGLVADLRARGTARAALFTWERAARETAACYVRALA